MTTTTRTRTERLCNQITAAAVYIVYYIAQLYNIRYFYVLFISGDLSEGARIPSLAWGCRRRVKINVTELIHNQLKKEKRKKEEEGKLSHLGAFGEGMMSSAHRDALKRAARLFNKPDTADSNEKNYSPCCMAAGQHGRTRRHTHRSKAGAYTHRH